MLVANSFDQWQQDSFFSAAEEVQESADMMESVFRRWNRERIEGLAAENLDELSRELQTALGTAKWQMEEFESAVTLSYRSCSDDITTARHKQFVSAIEDRISRVEAGLREYFNKDGDRPLQWVKLDAEECNDLAAFISGPPRISQTSADFNVESANKSVPVNRTKGFNDFLTSDEESEDVTEIGSKEIGSWKIVIADKGEQVKALQSSKQTCGGDRCVRKGGIISCTKSGGIKIKRILGRLRVDQRDRPFYVPINSVRYTLALMLMIFLFVPFVLYSS